MRGCRRVRFPVDTYEHSEGRKGFGAIPVCFRSGLKAELHEWCRRMGTTLVMSFFVAYVALVLRWCNVPEAVVLFQINGRTSSRTEHTVGYLASPLYLRIALLESDNFIDLLRRVTEEYCNAHEHADSSYLEAQLPPPDFTQNSRFNWLQQEPAGARLGADRSEQIIDVSRVPFELRMVANFDRDVEPAMGFVETDDDIKGYVQFSLNRFSASIMERFARNFLLFIETLVRRPGDRVKSLVLE